MHTIAVIFITNSKLDIAHTLKEAVGERDRYVSMDACLDTTQHEQDENGCRTKGHECELGCIP